MNATIQTDLRDDLDDLAETITIAVNRVRHAVKRDEQRAHSQRKGKKDEDANES